MKKWIAMLLAALLLTGCGGAAEPEAPVTAEVQTQSTEPVTKETMAVTVPAETESGGSAIRAGTWTTAGGIFDRYYIFDPNGISGQTLAFSDGAVEKFIYKESEGAFLFYHAGQQEPRYCVISVLEEGVMNLEWEDQIVETLIYVSPKGVEDFHFYTYDELCQMALEDYKAKHDPSDTSLMAAAGENGEGSVTVQIYQNLSDHNSTAAWYWVDRITGEGHIVGTDQFVDLTNGTAELAIGYFDASKHQAASFHEFVVDQSEYRSEIILTPEVPLVDVSVVSLEYVADDQTAGFAVRSELFRVETLTGEKPLILYLELPEIIPNVGVIYTDRTGETKTCTISWSGLDGSPLLTEEIFLDPK